MEEKKGKIFNQQALDRINSPEQLNDYLKVTNPGIWVLLAAVITLLAGFIAWASVGQIETAVKAMAEVKDGEAYIYLTEAAPYPLSANMPVRIGSQEYEIAAVITDEFDRTVGSVPVPLADGYYESKVVVESLSPIAFLFR